MCFIKEIRKRENMINEELEQIKKKAAEENAATVSVALFGQPGAGKSSLINALAGKKLAETGLETDKTVAEAEYEINGLNFIDLPGYGTTKFPKDNYFEKFNLLEKDIFLCVTSGKLHADDVELFKQLRNQKKTCIFVFNKTDDLWEEGESLENLKSRKIADISKNIGFEVNVLFTSCRNKQGLDELQTQIAGHLGQVKRDRWFKSATAYSNEFLDEKFRACEKTVTYYAALAAANGLNPIPGVDLAVDVGILYKLFQDIRESYGIDSIPKDTLLEKVKFAAPAANRIITNATKEGIIFLLKRFAGSLVTKTGTKYIPFVGQAIAASIGFGITKLAGDSYLKDCHDVAKEFFSKNISH